jgi:hypothetical protein
MLKAALKKYIHLSADYDRIINIGYPNITNLVNPMANNIDPPSLKNITCPISHIVIKLDAVPCATIEEIIKLTTDIGKKVGNNLSILLAGKSEIIVEHFWLVKTLIVQILYQNPFIKWNIFIDANNNKILKELIDNIYSEIEWPITFQDYRDELLDKVAISLHRKKLNIFPIIPYVPNQHIAELNEPDILVSIKFDGHELPFRLADELLEIKNLNLLISITPEVGIDYVIDIMNILKDSGKNIFFTDWVLQRLWDQKYKNIKPPINYPHYELIIDQDLNIYGKSFNENDLLWDSIEQWWLLKSEYKSSSMIDIEDIITTKILFNMQNNMR